MFFNHNGLKTKLNVILIFLLMITVSLSVSHTTIASEMSDVEMIPHVINRESMGLSDEQPISSSVERSLTQAMTSNRDSDVTSTDARDVMTNSPSIMFIENMGQFAEEARFQVRGTEHMLWLAQDALWISMLEEVKVSESTGPSNPGDSINTELTSQIPKRGVNIKLSFVGANRSPRIEPFNRLDSYLNYLQGNESEKWRSEVPVWGGVRYVDLYPGIDLEITSENGQLVQRLVADAKADISAVRLQADGAEKLTVTGTDLALKTAIGNVLWPLFQLLAADGSHLALEAYTLEQANARPNQIHAPFITTSAPAIPASKVQPSLANSSKLNYSTLIGGNDYDQGFEVKLDDDGHALVTGWTNSEHFPTTPGAVDSINNNYDLFVLKLNLETKNVVYSTFVGGSSGDYGSDLMTDQNGNMIVVGRTQSSDFPMMNALDSTYNDGSDNNSSDTVVFKLNSDGTQLSYSTFIGGASDDEAYGLALDEDENIVLTGWTNSPDFPTTAGVHDTTHNGDNDIFVLKLAQDGQDLLYSTFVGGMGQDGRYEAHHGPELILDASGNVLVTGLTSSSDFPTTLDAFQRGYGGGSSDVFVFKLYNDGTQLIYSTFIGGSNYEYGNNVISDRDGKAIITGRTRSENFPTTEGADDRTHNGLDDAFVLKLAFDGRSLDYSTFIGGDKEDYAWDLALGKNEKVIVTGLTRSKNFPITNDAYNDKLNNNIDNNPVPYDVFVSELESDGSSLTYSTFVGGSNDDNSYSLERDDRGNVIVTGRTRSLDFPTTDGQTNHGEWDMFIFSLQKDPLLIDQGEVITVSMSEDGSPTAFNLTLNASGGDGDPLTWSLANEASHGTANVSGTGASIAIEYMPEENYVGQDSFDVQLTDGAGNQDHITVQVDIQAVADTPLATNARTLPGTQTRGGLVISRHPDDGDEVTHLKITDIDGGTLYQNDGKTPIYNDELITFVQAEKGLKFTPASHINGTFNAQASTTERNSGLGGNVITATVTTLYGAYIHPDVSLADDPTNNEARMNEVFGMGNWQNLRYDSPTLSDIFIPTTDFIFMEGGQNDASEMVTFLTNHQSTVEEWVSGGGCLLLNASPTTGNGVDFGFDTSLSLTQSEAGTAANENHPIFHEPDVAGTSFTGTGLSEGIISGSNLTPLIHNGEQQIILGEKSWQAGRVAFGALGFSLFDSLEQPQHNNLHRNIIHYTANCGTNYPPVANNIAISPVITTTEGFNLVETAGAPISVTYDYFDANGDAQQNSTIRWTRKYRFDEQLEPGLNGKLNVPADLTMSEEYWCVTIRPKDGTTFGRAKESCAYIERLPNELPEAEVTLSESPNANTPLTLNYKFIDDRPETEDEDRVQLRWYRNGQLLPAFDNKFRINSAEINVGEEWCAVARVHDDSNYGKASNRKCTIINLPGRIIPFIAYPRISPPEPTSLNNLNLFYDYEDPGGLTRGPQNVEIRWFRNGQLQPELNNSRIVSAQFLSPGETWWATIRPVLRESWPYSRFMKTKDVHVSDQTIENNNVNSVPKATNLVISPQIPSNEDDLRLTYDFIDADSDSQGDTRIWWYKERILVEEYNGMSVIPADQTKEGEVWHALVIPHDEQEYGSGVYAHSVKVGSGTMPGNPRPEARDVYLTPNRPSSGDNLRLRFNYDDDNQYSVETASIKWFRDGEYDSFYDNEIEIPYQDTRVGQTWYAEVTPNDETDLGTPVKTEPIEIKTKGENTLPTVSDVHILPFVPLRDDDLVLSYQYFDSDGDLEGNTTISWRVDGKRVDAFENLTVIPSEHISRTQSWRVQIRATDGSGNYSPPTTSDIIINTPPTVRNAVITPSLPYFGEPLTLVYKYHDVNNHPQEKPSIQWYKNDSHQAHLDDQTTVPSTELVGDQNWYAVISTYDGYEYSEPYTTAEVTIRYLFLPLILGNYPTLIPTPTPTSTPPPPPTPTPGFYEENDTQETAYGPLNFDQYYEAYPEDEDDWYSIVITETSSLKVILEDFDNIKYKGQLAIYQTITNPETRQQGRRSIGNDGRPFPMREVPNSDHPDWMLTDLAPGTYWIRIDAEPEAQNKDNLYRLKVNQR